MTVQDRPFPWRCVACNHKSVYPATIPHFSQFGRAPSAKYSLTLSMPVHMCAICGAQSIGNDGDAATRTQEAFAAGETLAQKEKIDRNEDLRLSPLDAFDIRFALSKMAEWLRIKNDNQGAADVDHSGLLYRLLSGKPALPKPPPTVMSQPCYPLGEGKKVPFEFPTINGRVDISAWSHVWKWESQEKNLVRFIAADEVYQITVEDGKMYLQKFAQT